MEQKISKETAFAELVKDHENQWVAIIEKDGVEFIVGSGSKAAEASEEARAKGYSRATLFKVPSFRSRFIPYLR